MTLMGDQVAGGDTPAAAGAAEPEWTPESWTAEDQAAAEREGWDIFECDGSGGGPWQIQSFDDVDDELAPVIIANVGRLWEDDDQAWMFVWAVRSELHAKALAFIHAMNPQEWDAVKDEALKRGVPYATRTLASVRQFFAGADSGHLPAS
jgi:hypothetical protein